MKRRALLTLGAGVAAFGLAGHGPAAMAADERKGLDGSCWRIWNLTGCGPYTGDTAF